MHTQFTKNNKNNNNNTVNDYYSCSFLPVPIGNLWEDQITKCMLVHTHMPGDMEKKKNIEEKLSHW